MLLLSVRPGEMARRVELLYTPYHECLKAVAEVVLPKTVLSCHRCGATPCTSHHVASLASLCVAVCRTDVVCAARLADWLAGAHSNRR